MTRPQNCGSGFCSCVECPYKVAWGSTTDRILLLLAKEPLTKAEICRRLDLTHDQVANVLTRLRRKSPKFAKRVHIYEYTRHTISGRTYIRAIYALGDKPDRVRDLKPYTLKERSARCYQKFIATRNSSVFKLAMTNRQLRELK